MTTAPERLTPAILAQRYPRLYHMAEEGSWASIQQHGLLSTTALLDLLEVPEEQRYALEAQRRPESVPIHHPVHGTAWIRDNKPINETVLRRTLEGDDRGGVLLGPSTDGSSSGYPPTASTGSATRRRIATAATTSSSSTPRSCSNATLSV